MRFFFFLGKVLETATFYTGPLATVKLEVAASEWHTASTEQPEVMNDCIKYMIMLYPLVAALIAVRLLQLPGVARFTLGSKNLQEKGKTILGVWMSSAQDAIATCERLSKKKFSIRFSA